MTAASQIYASANCDDHCIKLQPASCSGLELALKPQAGDIEASIKYTANPRSACGPGGHWKHIERFFPQG